MAERISAVRVVPGDRWIANGYTGGPTQAFERYMLRRSFYDAIPGVWRLVTEPEERTEFDEEGREVKLWIGALAERIGMAEVAPTTISESRSIDFIDYGARGGQPFGYA